MSISCSTEAIDAIIAYSQDAEELLKRKKVHRDVIFKYLANEGVVMVPNTEKHQLIRRTIEFWSSGEVGIIFLNVFFKNMLRGFNPLPHAIIIVCMSALFDYLILL